LCEIPEIPAAPMFRRPAAARSAWMRRRGASARPGGWRPRPGSQRARRSTAAASEMQGRWDRSARVVSASWRSRSVRRRQRPPLRGQSVVRRVGGPCVRGLYLLLLRL